MSESGDYNPGPWKGYDFSSARRTYDVHVGRSYDDAVSSGKTLKSLLEPTLETASESPLVIACDVTGSMGDWPATIFSKLPYLDLEGKEYMGKGMEISFAAVGDAYSDEYPLQVRPFSAGKDLEKRLKELVIEGNGGGQTMESYDLAALYYARKVKMPKAINPLFIFIGDEGLYDFTNEEQAKRIVGTSIEKRLSSKQVMEELKSKFSVYLIRKPYDSNGGDSMSSKDREIQGQWADYLGADHIAILPEAGRVVDVVFGIMAKETKRIEYFEKELEDRQKPGQVKTVLKALETVHMIPGGKTVKKLPYGTSRLIRRGDSGKPSPPLV